MRIRPAESGDLPRVQELWLALVASEQALGAPIRADAQAPQQWLGSFERHLGRFSFVWVVEDQGSVLGFLLARLKTRPPYVGGELVGEISSVFVDRTARRKRSGQALVRTAVEALKRAGATAIEVEAHECNAAARAFWEAQGFASSARTYRLGESAGAG
jgi:ribosomal protein S18 acetylase RimI-like enzyme